MVGLSFLYTSSYRPPSTITSASTYSATAIVKEVNNNYHQVNENTIIYMENRFGRTVTTVLEWLGKLRGIL